MHLAVPQVIYKYSFWLALTFLYGGNLFAQPVANFSGTPTSGCSPLLVTFSDNSTGNPTSWKWDLGNGTKSILQNPSVTYFAPGKYKITLTATNGAGSNTIVKDQYITVLDGPAVDFGANPLSGCLPLPVKFSDKSTGGSGTESSWKWDFGDGVTAPQQNPTHIYSSPGTFDVTLQVINNFGCTGVASKSRYINIEKVIADFSNNIQGNCKPPVKLSFKNLSSGPASLTYKWDFGDGVTSTIKEPSHSYATAGTFTIKLTATSAGGCSNTIQKNITIGTVLVDFTSPDNVCPGIAFSLTNKSSPRPSSVLWTFGDGTTSDILDPVKAYKNSGTYTIKLVADFGACKDSISKKITVLPKQNISFTANDTGSCKSPLTVDFTSNVPNSTGFTWDFGDGSSSSEANPSHVYTAVGNYDVSLISVNILGCSDTLKKPAFIKIASPVIKFPDLPIEDCVPFTHRFSSQLNTGELISTYLWNFGDGTTDNTAKPTHTYNTVGRYNISLTITTASGCTATKTVGAGVKVGNKPTANFAASPLLACASTPINFTDLSSGSVDEWLWDFGDGKSSIQKNPIHLYQDTGYFNVTLTARSSGCADKITFSKYIYLKPPIAKFGVKNDCKFPKHKVFTDSSKGADTWEWNFGDGTTSTSPNNIHDYSDTGAYMVTLRVTNFSTGCDYIDTQTVYVIIQVPDFIANITEVCRGNSVLFKQQNLDESRISIYHWSFYEGGFSYSRLDTVSHIYDISGIYNARLIVTDLNGCFDTAFKPSYIKVQGPTALFSGNAPGTCVNKSFTFNDNSFTDGTHPITTWIWDYGDGTTETLSGPPFTHRYAQTGTYSVSLKIIASNGCTDSLTKIDFVEITDSRADFAASDRASCPFKPVSFNSKSTGLNLVYQWNFGDESTSNESDPVHEYSDTGNYSVSLKITDEFGCTDSINRRNYISIVYPKADFTLSDSISSCPPFFVTFNNLSTNFDTLQWDFGDGNTSIETNPTHFYYIPGKYILRLRAISPGGCYDEKTANIIVRGPTGILNYSPLVGCNTLRTDFDANAKDNLFFIWDFNDGATVKTRSSSISHTYPIPGFYLPKLILEDKNGCQVPIIGIDTIKVLDVKANFTTISKIICEEGIVSFSDSTLSNDDIANYDWSFGDGGISTSQNPDHTYTSPGFYSVDLTVTTNSGCTNTITKNNYIKITASPQIDISGNASGCVESPLTFKGIFLWPDTSLVTWKWDFDNGQTSTLQNPLPQTYSSKGDYIINAMATNSSGCTDTANFSLTINPLPDVDAGKDKFLCLGSPIQLMATGAVSYKWLDPADFLSCTNCDNPFTNTPDTKKYVVQGTSQFGCINKDSVLVKVKKPFRISVTPKADSLCVGQKTQLNASFAENYLWTPATAISNTKIANPIVSPDVTTTYKVVGFDSANCFKDSAFVKVTVFKYPTVEAGADKIINSGSSLALNPAYSDDIVKWMWTPATGLSCSNCAAPLAMPVETTSYTIKVINNGNCPAEDNITISVICNSENLFIPNTFSPNGNGTNDVFYPRGKGLNRIRGMKIFNRWGQLVFEKSNFFSNDPSASWDGTFKGQQLPSDVYTFIIDVICENTTVLSQSGTITLIR